jgi:hypothetical protein
MLPASCRVCKGAEAPLQLPGWRKRMGHNRHNPLYSPRIAAIRDVPARLEAALDRFRPACSPGAPPRRSNERGAE